MAVFSLRVVAPRGSPIPIAIVAETAMFQIVDPPAKIAHEVDEAGASISATLHPSRTA